MPISSAQRLLDVVRALNEYGPSTVSDIQKKTGSSRQAIYRLLSVLQANRYVARYPDQAKFHLTPAIRELSDRVRSDSFLEVIAPPVLIRLQSKVVWPTSLATFDKKEMVIRYSTRDRSPFDFDNARIGDRLPVLGSALGLAYLAFSNPTERDQILKIVRPKAATRGSDRTLASLLKQIRRSGYALRRGGRPRHTSSVAVPILNGGSARAGIVITFLSSAMGMEGAVKLFVEPLRDAAGEIARQTALQQRR
jgi:IclR family mhp operon transcriptional activator